jgi:hypothetical protein
MSQEMELRHLELGRSDALISRIKKPIGHLKRAGIRGLTERKRYAPAWVYGRTLAR